MLPADLTTRIRAIGRDVNLENLGATRALLSPLVPEPDPSVVHISRDVAYGTHARHRLDIFIPASGAQPERPLLIFVHGGGFIGGDKHAPGSPFYSNIGQWAVLNGFNAINITYRLAPEFQWPSGIEDLHAVMQFLRAEAGKHGLSSDKIFLMGQSAGAAHAASYIAHQNLYAPDSHGLKGLILLSGVYEYTAENAGAMEKAYLGTDTSTYSQKSNLQGLLNCTLPLLVTLSEFDPPFFEAQGLLLLNAWQQRKQHIPRFVHAIGQNHLSVAMSIGLSNDLIGPQIKAFIEQNT